MCPWQAGSVGLNGKLAEVLVRVGDRRAARQRKRSADKCRTMHIRRKI